MGSWIGSFLAAEGHQVMLVGRSAEKLRLAATLSGASFSTDPSSVGTAEVVILSLPIGTFESALESYAPFIGENQVVLEITSVKKMPVAAMHRYLKTKKVLGVHPMFGPGARDLSGHNFIVTPTNDIERELAGRARAYIETRGGKVTTMSPEEHDRTMAVVLGLPHIVALIAADILLSLDDFDKVRDLGGTTCKLLLMLADSVLTEDPGLYASLQTHIEGIDNIHRLLKTKTSEWAAIVAARDEKAFVDRMQAMKDKRSKGNPDFGKAYETMYRTLGGGRGG